MLKHAADMYFRALRFAIVACLVAMVVLVFGNVVLRYAFNSGITASEELSRWLFVWLTFLGAIVALREHAHLGMDSVVARLPAGAKKACFIVSHVLMLYAVYLFFEGSWEQTAINIGVKAPATGLSSGFFYGVGIVFCISAALILLNDLWRVLRGQMTEDELIQVKESEDVAEIETLQHELSDATTHSSTQARGPNGKRP
jgi:TRAP-type transport system small permease protein